MYFDTHCHLNSEQLYENRDEFIKHALDNQVEMTVMEKALTRMRHTGNRNIFPRMILTTRTANKAVLLDFMKVRIFSWNIS